jgi:MFS family permease
VVATWFPSNEVPVKSAYTTAIGCSGPIVGGVMVSNLVKEFDWIVVMRVFALFGLLLAALLWMIIRERNVDQRGRDETVIGSLKTIISSRQVLVLSMLAMAQYSPLSALGDLWGVTFIKEAFGVDVSTATLMNNMLYAGVVVGAPTFAYLAGFWNSYKKSMILGVIMATVSMSTIVVFCMQLPLWSAFALFFLTGFSCGSGTSLAFPLGMMMFPKSVSAMVSGFINTVVMMSGVILMPLIGYIINLSWNGAVVDGARVYDIDDYRAGLTTVVAFLIMGIFFSLMVEDRSPKENKRG